MNLIEVFRIPQTVVDKKTITIAEAKELLEKIEKINQFQTRTLDYARKFSKIDPNKAKALVEKLIQEFEIEREDAVEVVNCMPNSIEELRVFFSIGRKKLILSSQLEKMLKIIDHYR